MVKVQKCIGVAASAGLIVMCVVWIAAARVSDDADSPRALTIGHASENWGLLLAIVHSSGVVWSRHYPENPTSNEGLYYKASHVRETQHFSFARLRPRVVADRYSTIFEFHLLLPLLVFGVIVFYCLVVPAMKRAYRRRRGKCVKCAYDLRGAEHEACPECGAAIGKVNPA